MLNRTVIVGLVLAGVLTALPGCASKTTSSDDGGAGAAVAAAGTSDATNTDDFYEDVYKDGRYYVFGQEKTYEAWKQT